MLKRGAPVTRANTSAQSRSILQILSHRSQAEGPNNRLSIQVMGYRRGAALWRSYNQHADHAGQVTGEFLFYHWDNNDRPTDSVPAQKPKPIHPATHLLLSIASHQLAGRGRGNNVWLSPSGCLQFSILQRVSLASFPANKLVFIQYLFALAVVEACREDNVLGKWGEGIRLKWSNDIYALVGGEGEETKRKVGGILVNTSFSAGNVDIVIREPLYVDTSSKLLWVEYPEPSTDNVHLPAPPPWKEGYAKHRKHSCSHNGDI